jgi:phosphomethylpyrimidine synthase
MSLHQQPTTVTTGPIKGSCKIHVSPPGHPTIAVPFREVVLHPSAREAPVRLYDTSGPYTDPQATIDPTKGLAPLREDWLAKRGLVAATRRAVQPENNGLVPEDRLVPPCPAKPNVLVGRSGSLITQFEFARARDLTEEMVYVAHRENLGRVAILPGADERRADGEGFGAEIPDFITPDFVRTEIARGRAGDRTPDPGKADPPSGPDHPSRA